MALHTSEAILLDVFDLHETDRIVTLLTRGWGKRRGVARNARRKYSRFAGQLQPLAKVRATWFEKEGRELVRISAVELLRPAQRLQADLEGILLGSYLAEHMTEFAQESEASDHLYRLLDSTLEALLAGTERKVAARYFEAWVLRLAGIFPAPHSCPLCGGTFTGEGGVLAKGDEGLVCRACGGAQGWSVPPEVLDFLVRIGREGLARVGATPPPPAVLDQVEELCGRVRRHFLQRELNSYRVMRQTLLEVAETP